MGILRLALYLHQHDANPPITSEKCSISVVESDRGLVELWTWCRDVDDLLSLVEELLRLGCMPIAIGTLRGELISIESLDLEPSTLRALATASIELVGTIEIEYYRPPNTWMKTLLNKHRIDRISVNYRKKRAYLHVSRPIGTHVFYDNLLRVLKPMRIPP